MLNFVCNFRIELLRVHKRSIDVLLYIFSHLLEKIVLCL